MTIYFPRASIEHFTDQFQPISLDMLNEKAEMMARIDNKYVVQGAELNQIAHALAAEFDVLDIGTRRVFSYDTRYFDDALYSAYHEHHQGVRRGFKVRARRYVDANLAYLEVKLKGQRGMTVKHRLALAAIPDRLLDDDAYAFARDAYSNQYGKAFSYDLRATLDVRYQRISLVAKSGGERMTIDTCLSFRNAQGWLEVSPDAFIIETKSAQGRGCGDTLLRGVHVRPAQRCSKYCIGIAAMGGATRFNHFLPTMRKLGVAQLWQLPRQSAPTVLAA